ncbi:FAD-binding oxidoreductase [Agromyces mediolanus]|uniref:FAD-linked oxidase n=1 Tax=Agromyces mediolanus TaxID=41986 RepID=A0A918FHM3_AGRME|nr:FAD-binding oxidoreductase [Agromyces mediolanus]GGR38273.1 FAD-linked oxidase [Agromyces mediolanus]GLJ71702.1 FAD-linked oxidase [Agromyces mediolanus]
MPILAALQQVLPGRAFGPSDSEYDAGRAVFAGVGSPEAVVRPASAEHVAAAVRVAAEHGAPIAVRSGGHGSEPVDGGLVIDLAELDGVSLGEGRLVTVGGGARWGDVAAALEPAGLGVSSGDTRDVGVGGLTLGGGIGWLVRQQGLTVDALRSAELVTAAGEVLRVDAEQHPELFWAIRGGGGNFGVVTSFTFEAVPADGLAGGHLRFAQADAPAVLRAWREVVRADEALNSTLLVFPPFAPEVPAGPMVAVARRGSEAELRETLAPLLALDSLEETVLGPVAYSELLEDAPPGKPPFRFVGGNGFAPELDDALLEACLAALAGPAPTMLLLRTLGGAFGRVPAEATPIAFRDAETFVVVNAVLPQDAPEQQVAELRALHEGVLGRLSGVYGNFSEERGEHVIRAMYPPETLARLRRIKAEVDPQQLFRHGHAIAPA